jgi:hypothetical protein
MHHMPFAAADRSDIRTAILGRTSRPGESLAGFCAATEDGSAVKKRTRFHPEVFGRKGNESSIRNL